MINNELKTKIDNNFIKVSGLEIPKVREIVGKINSLGEEKRYLMKYLYSNLPLSDILDYSFEVYKTFVDHSLFVKKSTPWGRSLPIELFLSDVLSPRINNEKIESHRSELYRIFKSYIKKEESIYDAVVALNYASLEFGTYKSPSRRTISPLTFLKRTFGRCGEQSTFLVSLLRSFCIPARQVYTPRWAHSDDCHAWVEAWCDGKWHYLGACEPEPFLDKGWFNAASTRSMLLHVRLFDNLNVYRNKITTEGPVTTLSRTEDYAKTTRITIRVTEKNQPVSSALVTFSLVNYAHVSPITSIYTDDNGMVEITLGRGSVIVSVLKDRRFTEKIINIQDETTIEIDFLKAQSDDRIGVSVFDMLAPADEGKFFRTIEKEQLADHKDKVRRANEKRKIREIEGTLKPKDYKNKEIIIDSKELEKTLNSSKLNGEEVLKFLNNTKSEYGYKLIKTLDEKDLLDLSKNILEDHLKNSLVFSNIHKENDFIKYILAPRISFEEITPYKSFIRDFFTIEEKKEFIKDPTKVYEYIESQVNYDENRDFEHIIASPKTVLELSKGNQTSKDVLAVAILRSVGVPSRLNPENLYPEFLNNQGEFVYLDNKKNKKGWLKITADSSKNWNYGSNWSIERLESGTYRTYSFFKNKPRDIESYDFIPGTYRLLTVNRLPNGNTYNKKYVFKIEEGIKKNLEINLREIDFKEMFLNIHLNDFRLIKEGKDIDLSSILKDRVNTKSDTSLLAWLGEGEEPTEHFLTEMISNKDVFNNLDLNIVFVARDEYSFKNETLEKTITSIPKIHKVIDKDFYMQEPIARNLYVNPEELPLVVVLKEDLKAIYAFSGYTVGLSDLITNIVK